MAAQAARAYAANGELAALTAAGSVGAGLADRFSDLELDCYWVDPPDDLDRSGPVRVLGGDLEALRDYDPDEQERSDDYRLGDLAVTVSSFPVGTIDRFVDDVVLRADTDPVKHMRMAALHRCRPLHGPELISAWRARAVYPDTLVAAVVERSLSAHVLQGWAAREALAGRGRRPGRPRPAHPRRARGVRRGPGAQRHLLPHLTVKWQSRLISELDVTPGHFAERLHLPATSGKRAGTEGS